MILRALAAIGIAAGGALQAQRPATARSTAASHGFSVARLARLDTLLDRYAQENRVGGAVALVLRDGLVVYERAVGWADKEAGRRMTPDAIFRIASQTKALTSVAVMILFEEGKLGLDDPVSRYIPSFSRTTVAIRTDTGRAIVPAARAITIKDLLTHTAGISYGVDTVVMRLYEEKQLGPAAGYGWYTADKDEPICTTIDRLATLPFVAHPGTKWVYGYNTDILGCVVERASGMPLDAFIRTRITKPLGMTDTFFFLPADRQRRLTAVYASGPDGFATRAPEGARGQGHYVEGPRKSFSGGAGLVSTARDYARFLQMLLNGGTLDGVRILAPKTVALMTTNHVDTLFSARGLGFGLGFEVVERFGAAGLESVGTFSWGGAYGSMYLVDPAQRLVLVYMMQLIPNATDIGDRFPTLVYQALTDAR